MLISPDSILQLQTIRAFLREALTQLFYFRKPTLVSRTISLFSFGYLPNGIRYFKISLFKNEYQGMSPKFSTLYRLL